MKRVIITTCAVVIAAAAAQAQSWGLAGDVNRFGKEYLESKKYAVEQQRIAQKAQQKTNFVEKAIEQEAVRKYKQMYMAGLLGSDAIYAQHNASSQKAGQQETEGAAQKADASKTAQSDKKQKAEQAKAKQDKEKKGSWLAAFFGGRYPGESDESFRYRLEMRGYPASQPFK